MLHYQNHQQQRAITPAQSQHICCITNITNDREPSPSPKSAPMLHYQNHQQQRAITPAQSQHIYVALLISPTTENHHPAQSQHICCIVKITNNREPSTQPKVSVFCVKTVTNIIIALEMCIIQIISGHVFFIPLLSIIYVAKQT